MTRCQFVRLHFHLLELCSKWTLVPKSLTMKYDVIYWRSQNKKQNVLPVRATEDRRSKVIFPSGLTYSIGLYFSMGSMESWSVWACLNVLKYWKRRTLNLIFFSLICANHRGTQYKLQKFQNIIKILLFFLKIDQKILKKFADCGSKILYPRAGVALKENFSPPPPD